MKKKNLLAIIGPGILVAATGIGAGDLATAAFTGTSLGLAILWAVVLGAFFKYILNEGLTRWQLATGDSGCRADCKQRGNRGMLYRQQVRQGENGDITKGIGGSCVSLRIFEGDGN